MFASQHVILITWYFFKSFLVRNEKIQEDLLHAIQGRGAFGRFKTAIHCHNIENKWYKFREERLKEIAMEFCERHGLTYHYSLVKS